MQIITRGTDAPHKYVSTSLFPPFAHHSILPALMVSHLALRAPFRVEDLEFHGANPGNFGERRSRMGSASRRATTTMLRALSFPFPSPPSSSTCVTFLSPASLLFSFHFPSASVSPPLVSSFALSLALVHSRRSLPPLTFRHRHYSFNPAMGFVTDNNHFSGSSDFPQACLQQK